VGQGKAWCQELLSRVEKRVEKARSRFKDLAQSRTSDERIQSQIMEILERWYIHGKDTV
jgi:hypothetical protein